MLWVLLAIVAGVVYVTSLPGTGDAEARVRQVLASHGGVEGALPPPARLGEAIVAVEDENFYSNVFLNVLDGAGRAGLATLQGSGDPGGSTIAQQLAKNLYPHGGGLGGTLAEIGVGVELSLEYSKPEILSMYLNAIYYGGGYWGEVAAARGYFGVSPRRLSWAQATMLAGLPQAPSLLEPRRHPAAARRRQLHVIDQLVDNRDISQAQANAIVREPLRLLPATRHRRLSG